MNRLSALVGLTALAVSLLVVAGCNKEEEVGYGGTVKTAPNASAPDPGKKGGGGMTVDVNN